MATLLQALCPRLTEVQLQDVSLSDTALKDLILPLKLSTPVLAPLDACCISAQGTQRACGVGGCCSQSLPHGRKPILNFLACHALKCEERLTCCLHHGMKAHLSFLVCCVEWCMIYACGKVQVKRGAHDVTLTCGTHGAHDVTLTCK